MKISYLIQPKMTSLGAGKPPSMHWGNNHECQSNATVYVPAFSVLLLSFTLCSTMFQLLPPFHCCYTIN